MIKSEVLNLERNWTPVPLVSKQLEDISTIGMARKGEMHHSVGRTRKVDVRNSVSTEFYEVPNLLERSAHRVRDIEREPEPLFLIKDSSHPSRGSEQMVDCVLHVFDCYADSDLPGCLTEGSDQSVESTVVVRARRPLRRPSPRMNRDHLRPAAFGERNRLECIIDRYRSDARIDRAWVQVEHRGVHRDRCEPRVAPEGCKKFILRHTPQPEVRGLEPEFHGIKGGIFSGREDGLERVLMEEHGRDRAANHTYR